MKFDVAEFYSFTTEKVLDNAISYAQTSTTLSDDITQLLKQARELSFFTKGNIWMKMT